MMVISHIFRDKLHTCFVLRRLCTTAHGKNLQHNIYNRSHFIRARTENHYHRLNLLRSILPRPYCVLSSSDGWQKFRHDSNEEKDQETSRKPPKDDPQNARPPDTMFLLLATIATFYILNNLSQPSEDRREISWSAFLRLMLKTGEVEQLNVSLHGKRVYVYLRSGAVINGEKINSPGPHYNFTFGELNNFEEKLIEAQNELGIMPSEYIPVLYLQEPSISLSTLLTVALFGAVLYLFRGGRAGSRGLSSGSGLNPFGSMTRAKTTIINPKAKGGKGTVGMKDVAGMKEAKEEVQEFVQFLKEPERFKKLGAKMPKGALLCGPPGTGKTLLAKAVSSEADVPFISMAGSDFVELIGGLGAARVRDLFKQAHKLAPCIVYIDEVDAIGRARRSSNMDAGNGEQEQTLNQLLVEMDGMNTAGDIIILASTNRDDVLDKALLRPGRFDRTVTIDLPTLPERKEIFEVYLRKLKLSRKEEMFAYYAKRLAELTPGKSGADIANVCNEAAFHAARMDQKSVDQENFEYAIERVIAGLQSNNNPLSPEERKTVAYHEAGHVIVSWMLKHTEPILKISTAPRTNSPFGFKQMFPLDRKLHTNEQLFDTMCTYLGGRVAERMIFNRITTGAEDDLKRVTDIAYQQIVTFGMNERVGPISFPVHKQGDQSKKPYGDKLAREIDEEVGALIVNAHAVTEEILDTNKDKLHILASALLENEVLNYDDLVNLIGQTPHGDKLKNYYSKQKTVI